MCKIIINFPHTRMSQAVKFAFSRKEGNRSENEGWNCLSEKLEKSNYWWLRVIVTKSSQMRQGIKSYQPNWIIIRRKSFPFKKWKASQKVFDELSENARKLLCKRHWSLKEKQTRNFLINYANYFEFCSLILASSSSSQHEKASLKRKKENEKQRIPANKKFVKRH
jgi:hypothetical protein